jgi:hypothetical protein
MFLPLLFQFIMASPTFLASLLEQFHDNLPQLIAKLRIQDPVEETAHLLTHEHMEMLKDAGISSNTELDKLVPWFTLWGISNEMFPVATALWYRWSRDNGVPAEQYEDEDF